MRPRDCCSYVGNAAADSPTDHCAIPDSPRCCNAQWVPPGILYHTAHSDSFPEHSGLFLEHCYIYYIVYTISGVLYHTVTLPGVIYHTVDLSKGTVPLS